MEIRYKIKDALSKICIDGSGLIIQFWSPIETSRSCEREVLSAVDQPFSLDQRDTLLKYRLSCLSYYYCIDNNKLHIAQEEEEEDHPWIISCRSFGIPVATAFLDCSPQVIINPRVVRCSPLLRSAFQSGLTCFLTIPVFLNQTSSSTSVVGVLECSLNCSTQLLDLFKYLKTALESVGLNTYQLPSDKSYETIPGLMDAIDEAEAALELVCASLDLPVAQVWIPYENESNHTILSYTQAKGVAGVSMIGYFEDSDDAHIPFIKAYYVACETLPLNMGDGLSGKTLQTYEPYFCRNVYELRVNGLLGMLYAKAELSCFVICLKNINTGNLDYAFEFLWPKNRSYLILLESLLLTLKRGLPSFQFTSGAQLDDELCVLDVENSTGSGIGSFKILEKNRLSQIPKALEEGKKSVAEDCISSSEVKFKTTSIPLPREDIRQQTGTTVSTQASKCKNNVLGISESQGSNFVKRKLSDLYQEDNRANQDHSFSSNRCLGSDELIIEAENGAHQTLSHLPLSSNDTNIKKYIDEKYILGPDSYNFQFLDFEDERRMLDVDRALKSCIKIRRTAGTQTLRKCAQLITPCLKHAMCEIEEALEIVCESHHIPLAQVWIPSENDKHVPCSSSVEEPRAKQVFAIKLTGYCVDSNGGLSATLKEYYDTCDGLPLKIGDGLTGKALQTYEPHFCKNIYELDDNGLLALLPASTECSCLAICLRSIHIEDFDYAFEFLWPHRRCYLFLLKTLFVTLKRCLPNFKFASGAQLGDEISTLKRFYPSRKFATGVRLGDASLVPDGNISSQIPNALNTDLHERQEATNQEHTESFESVACPGDYELIIEAAYGDHGNSFYLHRSSKLADVKKNIDETYKLSPLSYKLEYQIDHYWVSLDDDRDWKTCIAYQKKIGSQTIRMRVIRKLKS